MTARRQAVKTSDEPVPAKFTLRPDIKTWRKLNDYCRKIEHKTGRRLPKNDVILEALNLYLDAEKARKRE